RIEIPKLDEKEIVMLKRKYRSIFILTALLFLGIISNIGAQPRVPAVSFANQRVGAPANKLSASYTEKLIVQGSDPLENPFGIITMFGYLNDFPPQPVERTKTEADQNTYVVLDHNPGGPKAGFDYGRHFLFQGHEIFSSDVAYITRINLDITDKAHRITLLTPLGSDGQTHMTSLDGSCWNPFTQKLLFTQEAG